MAHDKSIRFEKVMPAGAAGRNGTAATASVTVLPHWESNRLQIVPAKADGRDLANCFIDVPMSNAGDLIKAIAEVAVSHSPHMKEQLASDLRAALIALEFAAPAPDSENIARYPHR